MRVALVGAVETSLATLEELVARGSPPVAVLSLPKRLASRHSDFVDMEAAADACGIPFHAVENVNTPEALALVRSLDLDWLVVVGWSQICGPDLLALPRQGAIGYHPAALPRMRGRAVIAWSILLGIRETAGSLFLMEPQVDSGALIAQRPFSIDPRETAGTLIAKHVSALRAMWAAVLPLGSASSIKVLPQDDDQATYCAKRTAEDGRIDWRLDSEALDRLIRAVAAPYPGAFTAYGGDFLDIREARPWILNRYYGAPGQILSKSGAEMLVSCGDHDALLITNWAWRDGETRRGPPVGHRFDQAAVGGG